MLSTTALAAGTIQAAGEEGQAAITVTGAGGEKLCTLWGDEDFTKLLLLFYTDANGKAAIEADKALALNDSYWVGVQGETDAVRVKISKKYHPCHSSRPGGPGVNPDHPP